MQTEKLNQQAGKAVLAEQTTWQEILDQIPYAKHLGLYARHENGLHLVMPFKEELVGNGMIPAIHGGTIGGLMEITALVACKALTHSIRMPKLIDSNTDYLRSGRTQATYARAEIIRQGRRVFAVRTTAWQADTNSPIAVGRANLLIPNEQNNAV